MKAPSVSTAPAARLDPVLETSVAGSSHTLDGDVSDDYAPWSKPRRSSARMIAVSVAALLVGGVALAIALVSSQRPELSAVAPEEPAIQPASRAEEQAPTNAPPATAAPEPAPVPPAAEASAAAEKTEPAAEGSPEVSAVPAGGAVEVAITTYPPKARFYRNGKLAGKSPLTVEVPPGEKLKYEVAHECCYTRKLVVDGSTTEVTVAMRPKVAKEPSSDE
jgi:hypothetical protein